MGAVLWHIPISHYNEKARWALDWKGIDYEKRAPVPGAHMAVAMWLTRGRSKTFPVLQIDGRTIGDSSAIIAALDEIQPEPRLIPLEPAERARALELEEFFDEELAPHVRLLAFHELRRDQDALTSFTRTVLPGRLASSDAVMAGATRLSGAFTQARYRVAGEDAAAAARAKIATAFDRLDRELEQSGGEHLVGGRFTSADLTRGFPVHAAGAAAARGQPPRPPRGGEAVPGAPSRASRLPLGREHLRAVPRRAGPAGLIYQPPEPGAPLIGPQTSAVTQPP